MTHEPDAGVYRNDEEHLPMFPYRIVPFVYSSDSHLNGYSSARCFAPLTVVGIFQKTSLVSKLSITSNEPLFRELSYIIVISINIIIICN